MLWLFVRPTGVYLLDFFCSGIQFCLLLSPNLCFNSLLYLDLYEPRRAIMCLREINYVMKYDVEKSDVIISRRA